MDKFERWDEFRRLIGSAFDRERPHLQRETAELIADFLDHDEFGLAHDLLQWCIDEPGFPAPSPSTRDELEAARHLMWPTSERA